MNDLAAESARVRFECLVCALLLFMVTLLFSGKANSLSLEAAIEFEKADQEYKKMNYAVAYDQFKKIADKGNAVAQMRIGDMFLLGQGVERNSQDGLRWYRLAADQGNHVAQFTVGYWYEKGRHLVQNYSEALRWYKLASLQGEAGAQHNLAMMYGEGRGVGPDIIQAHKWFNIAATQGDNDSVRGRDIVAARMTLQQVTEAQRLAKRCMESNFKNCD